MKKRIMKNLIAVLVIIAMISVTACGKDKNKNDTNNEGSNTGDNTTQDNITEDNVGTGDTDGTVTDRFTALIGQDPSRDDVYGFFEENITSANEDDADQLVNGILGYEDTYENVDYSRLYKYKNYVSDEVEDFLELMYENEQTPYMNNDQISITLDELLDRAEDFEKHITEFPDGITTQPSYEMYTSIMNSAITGGYDKENNVESFYKGDADNRIDGRAVDEYMKFLADEVNDGNEDKVRTGNTATSNSANDNGATTGNSTANNNGTTNSTKNSNSDSANSQNANGAATNNTGDAITGNGRSVTKDNSSTDNTNTTNNTTTNNTANNTKTTKNSTTSDTADNVTGDTANVGDNSETNFTAPITRSIVQDYVDLLVKTKNEITTEVEDFYANLTNLISEKFDL